MSDSGAMVVPHWPGPPLGGPVCLLPSSLSRKPVAFTCSVEWCRFTRPWAQCLARRRGNPDLPGSRGQPHCVHGHASVPKQQAEWITSFELVIQWGGWIGDSLSFQNLRLQGQQPTKDIYLFLKKKKKATLPPRPPTPTLPPS